MKWYEVADDLGDGTVCFRRFRTLEEAQAWCGKMEDDPCFHQDGDGSPVIEIDTESKYFYYQD